MTEQEFRELTAYDPPAPPKQSPPVSSIAAAVSAAGNKGPNGSAPPPMVPNIPMAGAPTPQQAQQTNHSDMSRPPAPQVFGVPADAEHSPQSQISQIHEQLVIAPMNEAQQVPHAQAFAQAPVQTHAPAPVPAPVPESNKMVPLDKHNELIEQLNRLGERHKRMLMERDTFARQVTELKRALAEREENVAAGRDYKEEIRLLGKLIDNEQSLRKAVVDSGTYKPGDAPYARHDKLVEVFLNIVARTE